jgi:hypothetical protein
MKLVDDQPIRVQPFPVVIGPDKRCWVYDFRGAMHALRLKPGRRIGIAVLFVEAVPVSRAGPETGISPV